MDLGAISRDFECKILRPRNVFRKFRSEIRSESHTISRAAACRHSAQLLGTSEGREQAQHQQAAWISARSHANSNAKFRGRENFVESLGRKSAQNRTQSHAPQHADARHSCWGPPRVVSKLRTTRRHTFRRDFLTEIFKRFSRPQNFAIEIARDRAEIRCATQSAAWPRPSEGPQTLCRASACRGA